ncbi:hypothetical protein [Vibrio owensii]|uniref:hypothetical protein n=1 Tax=Vibrio owensii TaxID=696485 RepID=UPI0018F1E322|nr:hypothetical protein [Vibrio owensii]
MASLINTIKKSGASTEFISVASRALHKPFRIYRDVLPDFEDALVELLDELVINTMRLSPISRPTKDVDPKLVDFQIHGPVRFPGFDLPGELSASLDSKPAVGDLCAITMVPNGRGHCMLDALAVCIDPKEMIFGCSVPEETNGWSVQYFRVAPIRDARFHRPLPVIAVRPEGSQGEFEISKPHLNGRVHEAITKMVAMVQTPA